ncbi:MAG: hypothetical protein J0626_03065, partial [Rhodospirillaceae bacterium]|nr:hypothetical protein [Rhodospirillaceae bacterium]
MRWPISQASCWGGATWSIW